MPFLIRPATDADRAALVEQFLGLNLHEEPLSHDRRTDYDGAVLSLDASWQLARESDGHALVAEQGGRVIGHLFLQFPRDPVFVREALRPHAYVSDLFVREDARGAGVATALLVEAERLAVARGMQRMMIGVLAGNVAAEVLYARLGFAPRAIELVKPIGLRPSEA